MKQLKKYISPQVICIHMVYEPLLCQSIQDNSRSFGVQSTLTDDFGESNVMDHSDNIWDD